MPRAPKGYRLVAATGIHKGDRAYQQDQVEIIAHPRTPGCALAVLADGMGGKSGGRKAADQVILTSKQIFERHSHRSRETRGVGIFYLDSDPLAILQEQEVEFGALMSRPKVSFVRLDDAQHLLDCVAFE